MKVMLVVNCGSSSLKYQVFCMDTEAVLAKGLMERIGTSESKIHHIKNPAAEGQKEILLKKGIKNHKEAFGLMVEVLQDKEYGALKKLSEIQAIGHRVVHGGENFLSSTILDDYVIGFLEGCSDLAPLHNPANITGIRVSREIFSEVPQVCVFDTSFHQTMPEKAFLYGLPYYLYEKHGVRKYGFHGTSHQYVAGRAAEIMGQPLQELKVITCHLGNGASIAAVKKGISVDNSMGFTPMDGLVMGTRCGSIDPAIVPYIMEKEDMGIHEVYSMLNQKSGVLGISGISNDFRDLEKAQLEGSRRARVALEVFVYHVVKHIGSFYMIMGGADALIFTAGIGENSPVIRERICHYLNFAGFELDKEKNDIKSEERIISRDGAKGKVLVVPTNEELLIARETKRVSGL